MTAKSKYYKMTEGDDLTLRLEEFPSDAISVGTDSNGNPVDNSSMIATYPIGQELYNYTVSEDTGAIGSDGLQNTNINATSRGFAFVAAGSILIKKMRIMITQLGGTYYRLGIYDSTGTLIGKSARYVTALGIREVDLTIGPGNSSISSVSLLGGHIYYMAYWSDDTTQNFRTPILTGRSDSNAAPLMQIHSAPNQEMPDSMTSGASNTKLRAWLMITG